MPLLPSPELTHHTLKFIHYQTFIDNYQYLFFPRTLSQWTYHRIYNIEELDIEMFKKLLTNCFNLILTLALYPFKGFVLINSNNSNNNSN